MLQVPRGGQIPRTQHLRSSPRFPVRGASTCHLRLHPFWAPRIQDLMDTPKPERPLATPLSKLERRHLHLQQSRTDGFTVPACGCACLFGLLSLIGAVMLMR